MGTDVDLKRGGYTMEPRRISGLQLVKDVRAGMGDRTLMLKYQLTAKQLEAVLKGLLRADRITPMQLYERTSLSDSQITKAFVEKEMGEAVM